MIAKTAIESMSAAAAASTEYRDDSGVNSISIDLRGNQKIRRNRNYTLNDITYTSSSYSKSGSADVIPLILLEKQPKYPVYADTVGDVVAGVYEWIKSAPGNKGIGKAGAGYGEYKLQEAAKGRANAIVTELSQSSNAAGYWSNPQTYGYHMFGLFNIEGDAPIATYELPFYSDYFISTDGRKGWKTGGAEMWYGRNLAQLASRLAAIGYPTTPDWEFDPHYENLSFTFHLINSSPEATLRNTIWLYSLVAGTMYVQIENEKIDLSKVEVGFLGVMASAMTEYLTTVSSFFKSPNVYEIVVPGRFRWLWCSMAIDVKCVGKMFMDNLNEANGATKSMADYNAAFPEAYKVEVSIQSLLPQSFNQFNYFLTSEAGSKTPITNPSAAFAEEQNKILEEIKKTSVYKTFEEFFNTGEDALTSPEIALKKAKEFIGYQ